MKTSIPPSAPRMTATERMTAILPMLEFSRLRARNSRDSLKLGRSLSAVARKAAVTVGIAESTLWSWYCRYKRAGYDGLGRARRCDAGHSKFFSANPYAATVAARLFFHHRMSVRAIHEHLSAQFSKLPSYATVRNHLKTIVLARKSRSRREGRP